MATNGDAERLAQVERAIVGELNRRPPADLAAYLPEGTTDDVVVRAEAVGALCREAGRYSRDHGAYLDEISRAFADKLQAMTKEYAANMLAAEDRRMADVRRILGKIAG